MSISNTTESAILRLVYNATAWANYAANAATSPETNIVVGLHTGDPTDTGNMSSSEVGYTSYARVNVARTTGGWTESSGSVSPVANIDFPAGTGGSGTVTHFSTGKSGGGSAAILWKGTVTPNIVCGNGVTPRLTTATTITLD
ncbi:MAG: hypothetical protein ACK5XN_12540 [Bacteroidota bacterium]